MCGYRLDGMGCTTIVRRWYAIEAVYTDSYKSLILVAHSRPERPFTWKSPRAILCRSPCQSLLLSPKARDQAN